MQSACRAVWREPVSVRLHDDTVYTSPPPASGALLAFVLNIMDGFNLTRDSVTGLANMTTTVHRMVEAFKYSFARRAELGDPDFVNITEVGVFSIRLKAVKAPLYSIEERVLLEQNCILNSFSFCF